MGLGSSPGLALSRDWDWDHSVYPCLCIGHPGLENIPHLLLLAAEAPPAGGPGQEENPQCQPRADRWPDPGHVTALVCGSGRNGEGRWPSWWPSSEEPSCHAPHHCLGPAGLAISESRCLSGQECWGSVGLKRVSSHSNRPVWCLIGRGGRAFSVACSTTQQTFLSTYQVPDTALGPGTWQLKRRTGFLPTQRSPPGGRD